MKLKLQISDLKGASPPLSAMHPPSAPLSDYSSHGAVCTNFHSPPSGHVT